MYLVQIRVSKLPFSATEADIIEFISISAKVKDIKIVLDYK